MFALLIYFLCQVHSSLKSLILEHNSIGDVGCQALAGALHHSVALQNFVIRSNCFHDKGFSALGEALLVR
jgi:hypothetical protein